MDTYRGTFIDMHCDTLCRALLRHGPDADLYSLPDTQTDLEKLREGDVLAQFFAIYRPGDEGFRTHYGREPIPVDEYIGQCISIFYRSAENHEALFALAWNAAEILANQKAGKVSGVLTMEDGAPLRDSLYRLREYYMLGVRAISLTWNYENCLGYPNSDDRAVMSAGLKPFGKDAVACMQDMGILVDVSHLSDGGFYDVADICKKPFIATHSNCRALSPHKRNLTDDMIRALADHGGVMGLNFMPEFLNEDITDGTADVARMVSMVEHMRKVGGAEVIALGTDFDGYDGENELKSSAELPRLVEALDRAGFTASEIDKFTHENVLRVLRECL